MSQILSELNDSQKSAVLNLSGPMIIVAGPGSGKTKTLTHRIAYLLESGIEPEKILGLTFTNKAADEMRRRVSDLVPSFFSIKKNESGLFLGTFHRLAVMILRREAGHIGFSQNFSIYDEDESLSVMKEAVLGLNQNNDSPNDLLRKISFLKNRGDLMFGETAVVPEKILNYFESYQKILKQRSAFDFDDLLLKVVELFKKNPAILEKYQLKWQHVMVDEYQDTNKPQYLLIKMLSEKHRNLCVIGDDWQSIYGFRAADFKNILRFEKDWVDAKIFFLEQNYRSTQNIVAASQAMISKNIFRTEKNLFTKNPQGDLVFVIRFGDGFEEARWIRENISEELRNGAKLSDFAILFRTNLQSRIFEETFLKSGIQYQLVGGFKFYKRREIQDLQSYLQLIFNPDDFLAFKRASGVPRRGIGEKTLAALAKGEDVASNKVKEFKRLILTSREIVKELKPSEFLFWLCKEIKYQTHLEQEGETGKERWENVLELIGAAKAFDTEESPRGLERFLENIKLLQDADSYEKSSNRLTLMTLHSAKGLEFPVVFIVGLEEGILPHERSLKSQEELEEERRLLYVGMTRARKKLFLSFANTRFIKGEFCDRPGSRFLDDLPTENISFIEQDLPTGGQGFGFGEDRTIYLD
ncbi:MAG: hypothetical protein A2418_01930 [Candidatus Brennerbacteria bacterium RIFOXYC1_FULL_41_11]|uniref:DNA 3'-5' helicase n=1 Tax=Candidatus Brennerbacteria bacterium RIFOXYD1_FULL_41_16 TaxID=1797529 RepID=A0A1G1XL79_9BACT|nr:MAG: ATP-dependent DNA helicase PcrA [Parcubacteria group bacterium GW2011_GWB1_41_4]OGY39605.1 MAG: hypothetical protein A2391_01285 [Candidatus Brennerbacteria bacterium RIFOXYB1_FULL_41_13]OGY39910.1 MAG: hypothetical protein A2418_01930 [Candidatus Brennerbacteria bacterium RIFOXYC1_FULL_41_11]OGY40721.1 MAG: hypothetical protein A2570_01145 [Candidatus Brennerbacteria bacterium RIFOXYD1_FULL_41_16]